MRIDEAIKRIEYDECEHCSGLFCKQGDGCWHWHILEMLRELRWYREQDLIRRDDAIHDLLIHARFKNYNPTIYTSMMNDIPKAEPPIDECKSNCKKRFTCKHIIQGMFCNSRTGNEDGTPCCWEPKEDTDE